MAFCKEFNAATEKRSESARRLPVVITVYSGPFFHLRHQDPAGELLPEAGREDRQGRGHDRAAKVSARSRMTQLREIAEKKMKDLNARRRAAMAMIVGLGPRWASKWWRAKRMAKLESA
jgi:large subunit ribosomal protein L11